MLSFLLAGFSVVTAKSAEPDDQLRPAPQRKSLQLVWHDEFDGSKLDDRVQHALHWDGYGREHQSVGRVSTVPGVMVGWHTFALWWNLECSR
jgi:hypothetical protein